MQTKRLTTRYSWKTGQSHEDWMNQWEQTIRYRQPFQAGAISGGVNYDAGRLPEPWRTMFIQQNNVGAKVAYVISSYATPIAWQLTTGQWIVPNVRYSPTTDKHQALVRRVLHRLGIDTTV